MARTSIALAIPDEQRPQTRPFWTRYKIAVIGWVVCTAGKDIQARAASGTYSNNEFGYSFMNENPVAMEELLEDMIAIIKYVCLSARVAGIASSLDYAQ